MPSLHFGWALVIAWAVLIATKSKWRFFVLAHPVITLAAIVLTANHYWLDAVVATFLFGVALGVDWFIERRRTRRLARKAAAVGATAPGARSGYRPRAPRSPVGAATASCRQARSRD
jgi:hypothetical protein